MLGFPYHGIIFYPRGIRNEIIPITSLQLVIFATQLIIDILIRQSNAAPYGDYNAFFNNGVDQTVDGAAQPLPFANLVTADPQFVDPAAGNFHLQSSSPLIDAGDPKREEPNPEWINKRDIDGEAMP